MNIWLIQIGETLPIKDSVTKMRTSLLAEKLIEKGHTVLWWTSAFDHFKKNWLFKEDEELMLNNGLKIKAIKGTGYKKNISLSRFIDHRIIAWKFRRITRKIPKPDIIIASMPTHDLAYEAVIFAKENNIPILIDIRDPWPDIFLFHIPANLQKLAKVVLYNDFQMIKKTMHMAEGLIAVTNTFLEWGLKYANRGKTFNDKVFYLGYKKHKALNISKIKEKFEPLSEILKNKFIVFFVGTISSSYHNPFILLKGAENFEENSNIHFIISGDGELFKDLKGCAKKFNNMTLTGWLNQDEIQFFLKYSKIGICPATRIVNLPTNKAYIYLSAGLPIISAFHGDLKEIIEKHQIGFYYPPNDVDALVGCLKRLYEDKELYKRMSENACRVFDEMFDANKIYDEYARHIEMVAEKFKNSTMGM